MLLMPVWSVSRDTTIVSPLTMVQVEQTQDATFSACMAAAGKMPRWKIDHEDRAGGIIEGVAVTALLRFKDDWVIRLKGVLPQSSYA
jgi:Protein of unknown function (DUF1499)